MILFIRCSLTNQLHFFLKRRNAVGNEQVYITDIDGDACVEQGEMNDICEEGWQLRAVIPFKLCRRAYFSRPDPSAQTESSASGEKGFPLGVELLSILLDPEVLAWLRRRHRAQSSSSTRPVSWPFDEPEPPSDDGTFFDNAADALLEEYRKRESSSGKAPE
jgi:hypothetical protein